MDSLDYQTPNSESIYVDAWFREVYWKIGTLHLDRKEYKAAIDEICRFWLPTAGSMNDQIQEQAAVFLAEAFYYERDSASAHYFARYTFRLSSRNDMENQILDGNSGRLVNCL